MLDLLKSIPFFAALSNEDLERISSTIRMEYFPENHVIFAEGDAGAEMYVIKRGEVEVLRENVKINHLKDNDFFGEMALVSDAPRNASVRTITDLEVMVLSKSDLDHILGNNAEVAAQFSNEVIKRANSNF